MTQPTLGRIVLYKLSEEEAIQTNLRRGDFRAYHEKHHFGAPDPRTNSAGEPGYTGHIGHYGNNVHAGDIFPALVVRVWEGTPYVNLQVFLDGNDVLWATSVIEGNDPRQWSWPPRVDN